MQQHDTLAAFTDGMTWEARVDWATFLSICKSLSCTMPVLGRARREKCVLH
jgi:hypothetical protein